MNCICSMENYRAVKEEDNYIWLENGTKMDIKTFINLYNSLIGYVNDLNKEVMRYAAR